MAEKTIAANVQKLEVKFQDGTGSPLSYTPNHIIKASIVYDPVRPRNKTVILSQSAGATALYGPVDGGISGPGGFTFEAVHRDVKNVTDTTLYQLLLNLYQNAFSGGYASWVSTNPCTDTTHIMVDAVLTHNDLDSAGVDQILTAACYVDEPPKISVDGEYYKISAHFATAEEWART